MSERTDFGRVLLELIAVENEKIAEAERRGLLSTFREGRRDGLQSALSMILSPDERRKFELERQQQPHP